MKKALFLTLLIYLSGVVFSQVTSSYSQQFRANDTNGPMGECLFEANSDGEIIYQSTIEVEKTKSELKDSAIQFFKLIDKENIYDVRLIQNEKENYVDYDVNIASGRVKANADFISWERDRSTLRCHVKIEFKDGRYRYTVNPYETNRQTIRGEAKSDGRPNEIHWQRVNSLIKERSQYKPGKKKYIEYTEQIDDEIDCYQAEYNALQNFLSLISSYCDYVENSDKEADF